MRIEKVTGCICDSLTVDGVQEIDLTDEKRVEVLGRIGDYIKTMDLKKFAKAINNEIGIYRDEEDLEYASEFYLKLTNEGVIDLFEQFPTEWSLESEWLASRLRAYTAHYIRNMETGDLNWVLQQLTEEFAFQESDGIPCDCCGDCVTTYMMEI